MCKIYLHFLCSFRKQFKIKIMDLFNKKKLAALQNELDIATANLEATTKELADLQECVLKSYDKLTTYFKPKFKNKYFSINTLNDKNEKEEVFIKCLSAKYSAGLIILTVVTADSNDKKTLQMQVDELKHLKIITKQTFLSKGENK